MAVRGLQVQALGQVLKANETVCLAAGVTRMLLGGGIELCSSSGCLCCLSSLSVTSFHVSSLFAGRRAGGKHRPRKHGSGEDGGVVAMGGLVACHPRLGRSYWNSSKLLVVHVGLLEGAERLLGYLLLRCQLRIGGWLLGCSGWLARGFAAVRGLAGSGLSCGGLICGLRSGRLVRYRGVW